MREGDLGPLQVWVSDVRTQAFASQAHAQSGSRRSVRRRRGRAGFRRNCCGILGRGRSPDRCEALLETDGSEAWVFQEVRPSWLDPLDRLSNHNVSPFHSSDRARAVV
ncbi:MULTISPECIES: antitoxin MazE-like protein [Gordonia]|uniref:antitoxin MazE-like protein n=1 Tax=Gordonia TaxID=2053 RepID=UPI0032E48E43